MTTPITQRPLFSILHTSARPEKWREVYDAWMENCHNPAAVEYVLVVDKRWGFTELPTLRPQDKVILNMGRRCYVDGVNTAASQSTGIILIVNADDQFPCPNWDQALISRVPPLTDFVIRVSSGARNERESNVMVMPIMSRPRYERQGYVFYQEYESMYADNDLCESAYRDGVVVEAWDLLFPHLHPVVDPGIKIDAAYAAQNRKEAYQLGENILTRRRLTEYGRKRVSALGPMLVKEGGSGNADVTAVPTSKETIAVALPGERYSSDWVASWTRLLGNLGQVFGVEPFFCYSSNVYATRTAILEKFIDSRPQPDWMLWIDDDNLVTFEEVAQLIMDLKVNPEFDMICGWCWQAGDVTEDDYRRPSVGVVEASGMPRHMAYEELMGGTDPLKEIGFTGFPVVVMRRAILQKVGRDAFSPLYGPLFTRGYAGEDVSFCLRAREAGVRIMVDRRVKVPHLKLRSAEPRDLPAVRANAVA